MVGFIFALLWCNSIVNSYGKNSILEQEKTTGSFDHAVIQGLRALRKDQLLMIRLPSWRNGKSRIVEEISANGYCECSFVISNLSLLVESTNLTKRLTNIVLIVESIENLKEIFRQIEKGILSRDGDYLVFVEKSFLKSLSIIFKAFWELNIFNVNIVQPDFDGIQTMWTFFPLNKDSCSSVEPVAINTFNKELNEWSQKVAFPQKFRNFFQCPINVFIHELYGFDKNIFYELALQLNFSVKVIKPKKFSEIGNIYPNGTATDTMALLKSGIADMMIRILAIDESRAEYLSYVNNFFDDYFIIIVPPVAELSSFSKIFYPFQVLSWIALLVFVACIVLTIKFSSKYVYNFIIGQNIRRPYLNIVTAFVGTTQQAVPKGFFARTLLSMFLLFCLIVRTMYIGKLYSLMRSNIRPTSMSTIDEYYNNGFEFYVRDGFAKKFQDLKYFKQ